MLGCDELVGNFGRDRVISMRGRVLGGSRTVSPIPGEWICPCCLRPGCWPTKSTFFRCGTARPNSSLPPGPVPNVSRFARAPREQRHPGRVPGSATGGCPTERRSPPQASSAPPPFSVPTAEGLSLDLVFQFLRALNVPPTVLLSRRRLSRSPKNMCSQLRSKVDITKQQLAKLSKREKALAKEHTEVAEKVVAKQTELEVESEDARRLIMQPTLPPAPPPSQAPRGHSSPKVSDVASSGMAVDAELLLPTERG